MIRSLGKATVAKIINAKKESGTPHFTNTEREAILRLF